MSFGKRYDGPATEAKRGIGQLRAVVKVQRDRIIASYVPSAPRRRVSACRVHEDVQAPGTAGTEACRGTGCKCLRSFSM